MAEKSNYHLLSRVYCVAKRHDSDNSLPISASQLSATTTDNNANGFRFPNQSEMWPPPPYTSSSQVSSTTADKNTNEPPPYTSSPQEPTPCPLFEVTPHWLPGRKHNTDPSSHPEEEQMFPPLVRSQVANTTSYPQRGRGNPRQPVRRQVASTVIDPLRGMPIRPNSSMLMKQSIGRNPSPPAQRQLASSLASFQRRRPIRPVPPTPMRQLDERNPRLPVQRYQLENLTPQDFTAPVTRNGPISYEDFNRLVRKYEAQVTQRQDNPVRRNDGLSSSLRREPPQNALGRTNGVATSFSSPSSSVAMETPTQNVLARRSWRSEVSNSNGRSSFIKRYTQEQRALARRNGIRSLDESILMARAERIAERIGHHLDDTIHR